MRRTGRSSFMSVGYHFRSSSGSLCVRPRAYSPPGMSTMPGSAAHAAAQTTRLAVNSRDLIRRNVAVRAKRIDVGVGAAGWSIANLLRPVDAKRGVHRGHHVLRARLLFVLPAGLQALLTFGIRAAQHAV